jgi:Rhodopirellula transposase DDE domain
VLATGALTLLFGTQETSDFWVDGLKRWWAQVQGGYGHIRRLVIYLDNGPNNSGSRTQFLKRMIEFADWSGLVIRLVYYPPRATASKSTRIIGRELIGSRGPA